VIAASRELGSLGNPQWFFIVIRGRDDCDCTSLRVDHGASFEQGQFVLEGNSKTGWPETGVAMMTIFYQILGIAAIVGLSRLPLVRAVQKHAEKKRLSA